MSENPTFNIEALHLTHEVRGDLLQFNGVHWTRIPAGTPGQALVVQAGGLWGAGPVQSGTWRYKASDTTRTSPTLQPDPDLQFPAPANSRWALEALVFATVTAETGLSWAWSGPTGTAFKGGHGADIPGVSGSLSAGTYVLLLRAHALVGATAGTISFAWGSDNGTVEAGSWLFAQRLDV